MGRKFRQALDSSRLDKCSSLTNAVAYQAQSGGAGRVLRPHAVHHVDRDRDDEHGARTSPRSTATAGWSSLPDFGAGQFPPTSCRTSPRARSTPSCGRCSTRGATCRFRHTPARSHVGNPYFTGTTIFNGYPIISGSVGDAAGGSLGIQGTGPLVRTTS